MSKPPIIPQPDPERAPTPFMFLIFPMLVAGAIALMIASVVLQIPIN